MEKENTEVELNKKKPKTKKENIMEWIKDLVIALILALVFLQFIMPTIVRQHSMENTLEQNDYVFVSKKAYTWFGQEMKLGDIIVFNSDLETETGSKKLLVKRIIGVAGDSVEIKGGYVYLNGKPLQEDYTKDGYTGGEMAEVTVPEGHIFVLGDNRQNSTDSRSESVDFVRVDAVCGKVVLRIFPLSRFGGVK